jgi:chromosome segregation ATPase
MLLWSPLVAAAWTATPRFSSGIGATALLVTPHVVRNTPPHACDGEWLSSADVELLQQEISLAQCEAADASRNAQQLAVERDAAIEVARGAADRVDELEADVEAIRELAAQEDAILRDEIDELRQQLAGDHDTLGMLPTDVSSLEREVLRLSDELDVASDRAVRAEVEAADLRAELEAFRRHALGMTKDSVADGVRDALRGLASSFGT